MDDLISRQAAIDVVGLDEEIKCEMCKNPMHTDRGCDGNCQYDAKLYKKITQILDKRITQMSTAKPKTGRWMFPDPPIHKPICSECGEPCIGLHAFVYNLTAYCPHCGAKMEGNTDATD